MTQTHTRPTATWTADALLSIGLDAPETLFSQDAVKRKAEYRALARVFHPDFCSDPRAAIAFDHLRQLWQVAEDKAARGTWQRPYTLDIHATDGRRRRLRYAKKIPFDLGVCYIARTVVVYAIAAHARDLFERAAQRITHLRYADAAMKAEIAPVMPRVRERLDDKTHAYLVIDKDPDMVRLQDYMDWTGGFVDPRHAAWILSGLHNAACYLEWAGIAHGAIGPDTWFIGPAAHNGALIGGWFFSGEKDAPLAALPARSADEAPHDILRAGRCDPRLDLYLIRRTGREMLGNPNGMDLARDRRVPDALSSYLCRPTSASARKDYDVWMNRILPDSFGPRRYVPLDLPFGVLYPTPTERRPPPAPS